MKLNRAAHYPVSDHIPLADLHTLFGEDHVRKLDFPKLGGLRRTVRGKMTGEKRAPKKGEWYLSGADIAAYRAPNDLSTEYYIAKLVVVSVSVVTVEREVIAK